MIALVLAAACATGEGDDGPLGLSFAPGEDDDGEDDDAATKGGVSFTDDGGGGSTGEGGVGKTTGSTDDGDAGSGASDGAEPFESSGGALESSDGEPADDDDDDDGEPPPPTGDPMYSPCDGDSDCADGICLIVLDQYRNQLSAFCTGPCAFPQADCEPAPRGDTTPACLIATEGESICTLDCAGGAACPNGMQCEVFPGDLLRCI